MDIKEIQNLIKFVAKSGASEVKLEMEDFKITIRTGSTSDESRTEVAYIPQAPIMPQQQVSAPVQAAPASTPASFPAEVASTANSDSKYITIKSPIIGTFYRKPSPDKPAFVEVGSV